MPFGEMTIFVTVSHATDSSLFKIISGNDKQQEIMNKFKYQTSNKDHQKIWICASCKKGQMDAILTGKLKLIDQSNDPGISCDVCKGAGNMVAQGGNHLTGDGLASFTQQQFPKSQISSKTR